MVTLTPPAEKLSSIMITLKLTARLEV